MLVWILFLTQLYTTCCTTASTKSIKCRLRALIFTSWMRAIPVRRVVSPGNFSKACNNEERFVKRSFHFQYLLNKTRCVMFSITVFWWDLWNLYRLPLDLKISGGKGYRWTIFLGILTYSVTSCLCLKSFLCLHGRNISFMIRNKSFNQLNKYKSRITEKRKKVCVEAAIKNRISITMKSRLMITSLLRYGHFILTRTKA